jgi:hypothetical protein
MQAFTREGSFISLVGTKLMSCGPGFESNVSQPTADYIWVGGSSAERQRKKSVKYLCVYQKILLRYLKLINV